MNKNSENYTSIRDLLAGHAQRIPDKTYVHAIDQDKTLSYGALHRLGNRMAQFFRDRGLVANDRILMLAENSVEFMAVFIGVPRHGATIATANVEMNRDHIAEIIAAVAPKLVLAQDGLGLEDLRAHAGAVEWMALGDWNPDGKSTGFFAAIEDYSGDEDLPEVCGPDDIAVIF